MIPSRNLALIAVAVVGIGLLSGPGAYAKRRPKPSDIPEPAPTEDAAPTVAPGPPAAPALEAAGPLWPASLPLPAFSVPSGLANLSAQGCAGCHPAAAQGWGASVHGRAPSSTLREAAAAAAEPRCLGCHLPLQTQHATPNNLAWDAVLHSEGVTCAACHVRDGHVVGPSPNARGPHPGRWSNELGEAQGCAACHQLTWPGADVPLYDTVGEWRRSAWATAGVGCVDCHMRGDPSSPQVSHQVDLPTSRAVSLAVEVPGGSVSRGAPPTTARIVLQNTGAGHAWPSGSPFRGARVTASLEGPARKGKGRESWGPTFSADLRRTLESVPPWKTTADTRLPAGGTQIWTWPVSLPTDAPAGPYTIKVAILPLRGSEVDGDPLWVREVPFEVR